MILCNKIFIEAVCLSEFLSRIGTERSGGWVHGRKRKSNTAALLRSIRSKISELSLYLLRERETFQTWLDKIYLAFNTIYNVRIHMQLSNFSKDKMLDSYRRREKK
jgi:hypothetical protein